MGNDKMDDDNEVNDIVEKLDSMFDDYNPVAFLAAIGAYIPHIVSECAPNETTARRTLELLAATILMNGSFAISEQYDEQETRKQ